jgi:hypothetical protein
LEEDDDRGVDLERLDLIFFDEKNRDAEAELLVFFAGVEDDYSDEATARWRWWSSAWFLASELAEKIEKRGGVAAVHKVEKEEAARVPEGIRGWEIKREGKVVVGGGHASGVLGDMSREGFTLSVCSL